ncbi:HDOD domain-containing protein [Tepidimonas charontis]|uniref:HDOD domain protein n=1 Tax=Tepidimonas charontis TaxID=2267262 RepID=A0A554X9X5_9BURK|nr:HDOD domain-containing protein [Tepidimonas charontis]TSE32650.1 HDOD domain protein [Tepidimonas charontis]
MSLQALLQRPEALPVVPEVAAELIRTFRQDDVDLATVAGVLERDPALAARVLRQANSAFFRLLRPVHSVREAVQVLGLNRVRALTLAAAVQQRFPAPAGIDLERFWAYSFGAASLARRLCAPRRLDDNVAFTAALLHAVGELVMHQLQAPQMLALEQRAAWWSLPRPALEYEVLGYSYAEVGAALCEHWRLPRLLVVAIAQHLEPLAAEPAEPLAAVVHLTAWRARVWMHGNRPNDLIHTYPDAISEVLGVDPDFLADPAALDAGGT